MMRIGLVMARPPAYSETFIVNKIKGLIANGVHVELYVDNSDKSFTLCSQYSLGGYVFTRMLSVLFRRPARFLSFLKAEMNSGISILEAIRNLSNSTHLLRSRHLDWIHFEFATMAVGRENVASVIRAKMGVSIRGYDISRYPLKHPGVYRRLWTRADKIHTISDALIKKAVRCGKPNSLPVVKIHPSIDFKLFGSNHVQRTLSGPVKLLTVARLHWVKGLDYTIQALSLLKKEGFAFTYTIVGSGPEKERLTIAVRQSGLEDRVTFAGTINHSEIGKFYSNADIYVQYSVQEGFCNSVLEAQAAGLLCIVSDAEGLPENVQHERTGWVVPARQPAQLAEKIKYVAGLSSGDLQTIRDNAIRRVEDEFDIKQHLEKLIKFYDEGASLR